jgi:hypothetical protein
MPQRSLFLAKSKAGNAHPKIFTFFVAFAAVAPF